MLKQRRQQKISLPTIYSITPVCESPVAVFWITRSLSKKSCQACHDQLDLMILAV